MIKAVIIITLFVSARAGAVAMDYQGVWLEGKTYKSGQVVIFEGKQYISNVKRNRLVPNQPSSGWTELPSGGSQGPMGPVGSTGPQGPAGPMGATGPMGPAGQGAFKIYDANNNLVGYDIDKAPSQSWSRYLRIFNDNQIYDIEYSGCGFYITDLPTCLDLQYTYYIGQGCTGNEYVKVKEVGGVQNGPFYRVSYDKILYKVDQNPTADAVIYDYYSYKINAPSSGCSSGEGRGWLAKKGSEAFILNLNNYQFPLDIRM